MSDENVKNNKQYKAFARDDYDKWDKYQFIFFGITFLGPLKFLVILSIQKFTEITLKFLTRKSLTETQLQNNKEFIKKYIPYYYTVNNFLLGLYVIKKKIKFDQTKHPKLIHYPNQLSNVVISNHISTCDVILLLETQITAYVTKLDIKKLPIWGPIGDCYDSIYIDRKNKENRKQIVQQIAERYTDNSKFGITIFPEGTTSNGKYLLKFKSGAFIQKKPVQFRAIQYIGEKYKPNTNMMNALEDILGIILQFSTPVILYQLEGSVGPVDGLDVEEYTEAIRDLYVDVLKIEKTEFQFEDKKNFETKYVKEAKEKLCKQFQNIKQIQCNLFLNQTNKQLLNKKYQQVAINKFFICQYQKSQQFWFIIYYVDFLFQRQKVIKIIQQLSMLFNFLYCFYNKVKGKNFKFILKTKKEVINNQFNLSKILRILRKFKLPEQKLMQFLNKTIVKSIRMQKKDFKKILNCEENEKIVQIFEQKQNLNL